MTNEEAKLFLDNLKICIDEHPIVADWLVEIADRKDENSSEKPKSCKTCKHDSNKWYELPCETCCGYRHYEPKDEPTISKMEQVDEPQTEEHCENCRHKDECEGATYEYKNTEWWCLAYAPIDEPQTDCAWK